MQFNPDKHRAHGTFEAAARAMRERTVAPESRVNVAKLEKLFELDSVIHPTGTRFGENG